MLRVKSANSPEMHDNSWANKMGEIVSGPCMTMCYQKFARTTLFYNKIAVIKII